jgi:hypothetical protein
MGDIWPYGGPRYTTYARIVRELRGLGMSSADANTGAAVADYESSFDWMVVNDTPATGDYSVGLFQINYYDGLRPGRVAAFGTPAHLARSGVAGQCRACWTLWQQSGWSPWAEVASGAYLPYLQGGGGGGSGSSGSAGEPEISEGDSGPAVQKLQTDLNLLGYALALTGEFNAATHTAVLRFQRAHHLAADGIVGPLTWSALDDAVSGGSGEPPGYGAGETSAAPAEAPAGVDPGVVAAWQNLHDQTGPYVNGLLQAFNTLTHSSPKR